MSELGDRHNKGKPGLHLLPMDALAEIAKVYDFGAQKYSKRYNNVWHVIQETVPVVSMTLYSLQGSVVVAMTNNSNEITLNMSNDKGKILNVGCLKTLIKSKEITKNNSEFDELIRLKEKEIGYENDKNGSTLLESQNSFYKKSTLEDALSARKPNSFTLITVIKQENIEEYYVANTTTASGSLMMTLENLQKRLGISKKEDPLIEKAGAHNWAKGLKWDEGCKASLLRHLSAWSGGEYADRESGLPHDLHIAWNAITMVCMRLRGIGEDDRYFVKNRIHEDISSKE